MDLTSTPTIQGAMAGKRVALIHYWYVRRRGGERVLDVLAEMYPHADIFVMVADKGSMLPATSAHKITTSFLQKIPGSKRHYRSMMALYPLALEQFDLRGYDVVISQEAGMAKGVLTRARTFHLNYCHSPMRYVWEMYQEYKSRAPFGALGRAVYALSANYVRQMDCLAATRVNNFVASSRNAERRIRQVYGRSADVVYPPVDLAGLDPGREREDFYLVVSPLVAYKRVDLAIEACNLMRRRLVVIGEGEENGRLRHIAGPMVKFLGRVPDEVVRDHYSRCCAFLFPGEEDIGLAPIEAQGSGAPVIAYGAGGVLETVRGQFPCVGVDGNSTGVFFTTQTVESLAEAMLHFEDHESQFSAECIAAHAAHFAVDHFKEEMAALVEQRYREFNLRTDETWPQPETYIHSPAAVRRGP
jgi:glycosyltransferase involved in cell wall biosynthesis